MKDATRGSGGGVDPWLGRRGGEVEEMSHESGEQEERAEPEGGGGPSRRVLSAEKKYQIFLEAQREEKSAAEVLRREGLYSTDLARIRKQVKEGALERLSARPGRKAATVAAEQYERLKRELEEKERVLAEMSVELAMLRKKTNGGTWER